MKDEQSARRQPRIKIGKAIRGRLKEIAIEMDNREVVGDFHCGQ
jgi:hypothetical protein